jgi:hypothetical protein
MHHEVGGGQDRRDPDVLPDPQIAGTGVLMIRMAVLHTLGVETLLEKTWCVGSVFWKSLYYYCGCGWCLCQCFHCWLLAGGGGCPVLCSPQEISQRDLMV